MMRNRWPEVALGEILTERNEAPSVDAIRSGAIPVISKIRFLDGQIEFRRDSTSTKTKMILIYPGDLILSGINAMKGAITVYARSNTKPVAATIHYAAYQVNREIANIEYLWWLLRSPFFREVLQQQVPQGIKTELKAKRLLPVKIPLPPLGDQQSIVARIEALAGRITEARDWQLSAYKETRALILAAIAKELLPYKNRKPFADFFAEPLRNGLSLHLKDINDEDGVPFIKSGAVSFGRFDPLQVKLVKIDLPADSTFWIQPNDLLMGRGNSLELVGRAVLFRGEANQFAFPDLIIRVRLDPRLIDLEFVEWYLKSSEARYYIEGEAQGTSPTMKKVSQPIISSIPIPDIPIDVQQRITTALNAVQQRVDEIMLAQNSSRTELDALLPSALNRIFRGEL